MNKQEIIEKIKEMTVETFFSGTLFVKQKEVIKLIEQLDEPQAGHSEEAPRYVKNILARLRELPEHDREVWLKAIMAEFEQDFSRAKWREGYEQGKFEGALEREKVKVPQFVADWIEYCKFREITLAHALYRSEEAKNKSVFRWLFEESGSQETFAQAWIFGYEVEEEKQYLVKIKSTGQCLGKYYINNEVLSPRFIYTGRNADAFTRKELEDAGFGWVFDCPGVEVEEVE